MAVTKFPRTIKVVVIGAAGVGKTSMRGQYISQRFSTGYRATIGADFITKLVKVDDSEDGEMVALQIWDTAGQERFSSLSSAFFRGADAAILVFDVNTRDTMHALQRWWDQFKVHAPLVEEDGDVGNFCVMLVGNKVDLEARDMEDAVSHEEARAFMDKLVPPELYHEEEEEDPLAASQMTAKPTTPVIAYPSPRPHSPFTSHSRPHSKSTSPYHQTSRSKSAGPSRSPRPYASSSVSGLSIYHTPSSSFYDQFDSAQNSPELSGSFPPPSVGSSSSGNMSAVTLTPSNWDQFDERGHLNDTANGTIRSVSSSMSTAESFFSAFSTGPGSSPRSHSPLHASVNSHPPLRSPSHPHLHLLTNSHSRPHSPSLLKPLKPHSLSPLRLQPAVGGSSGTINSNTPPKVDTLTGPRLFFASAKTGEGVPDIFEYVARRVVRRWDYEDNLEREREEEERYRNGVGQYERQFAMRLGVESGSRNRNRQQRPRQQGGVMKGPVNGHGNGIRVHGHSDSRDGMTAMRGRARDWASRAGGMSAGSCCS